MYTWFDRDLGVSGRVIVDGDAGKAVQRLVQIKRPVYRVPSLAIHLNRSAVLFAFTFASARSLLSIFDCTALTSATAATSTATA